ncbi:PepSY domain-containing protein [Virgibacillus sp. NKC19-16]|uniref:PepSY domain-containing protein n=1 Tax=Virgibacillus salidurans TaxID=2831673 RepID=UPI001F280872|nr:PepSY domain-containing protein [Virgibacillus sp. NKC19-16]UJL47018.1 PepSY domain-containing protein [Virgibacillus sp. NKC19-16]
MKKKLGVTIGATAAAAVLGLGIYQSNASETNPELSTDEIRQMVTDQYPGTITELELEKDSNRAVYEVEVENDGKEYDIKLDGSSGEVLNLKERELSSGNVEITEKDDDADDRDDNADDRDDNQGNTNNNDSQDDGNNNGNSSTKSNNNTVIDLEKAEEIALNEFDGKITDLELDEDDGRRMYEIELEKGEDEAEIEIDAYTGEILVIEIDREDD